MRGRPVWAGSVGLVSLVALCLHCAGAPDPLGKVDADASTGATKDAGSGHDGASGSSSSGGTSSSSGGGSSSSGSGSSSGSTSSSGSGSGSSSGSGSGSGSGSSSGSGSACVDPGTVALCTACQTSGQPCQLNGCYGGYLCDTNTNKCVAPGANCP